MKRIILIIALGTALLSCKKEEVDPSGHEVPAIITNRVRITVHTLEPLDSINVTSGNYGALVRASSSNDFTYYLCNLVRNLRGFSHTGDCETGEIELTSGDLIYIEYSGDVTIEYLESSL